MPSWEGRKDSRGFNSASEYAIPNSMFLTERFAYNATLKVMNLLCR